MRRRWAHRAGWNEHRLTPMTVGCHPEALEGRPKSIMSWIRQVHHDISGTLRFSKGHYFNFFILTQCLLLIILTTSCSHKFPKGNLFDLMILRKLLTKPTVQTTTTATTTPTVNTNKYIFVTATKDGNLAGIAGADTYCQSQKTASFSSLAGDATEYKALLVDSTGTRIACTNPDCSPVVSTDLAKWVLKANTDYYRLDGTTDTKLFTTNSSGIVNFTGGSSLLTAIDTTGSWWTGLATDWTDSGFNCNNWTSNSATFGKKGNAGNTNANAIAAAGTTSCAVLNKIICVRQ